jgi:hypothetical protein
MDAPRPSSGPDESSVGDTVASSSASVHSIGTTGVASARASTSSTCATGMMSSALRIGAGISAMPSLHVTLAFLCFLVAREYARHFLPKLIAALFAAVIFLGSVHLGWHYVSDGGSRPGLSAARRCRRLPGRARQERLPNRPSGSRASS